MKFTKILTGLTLIIFISSFNWLAGFAYTYGGGLVGFAELTFIGITKGNKDPRFNEELGEDGVKNITLKENPSFMSLLISNRYGIFGVFLLIFSLFQMGAGIAILAVDKISLIQANILGVIAALGIFTEIAGITFTQNYGISNGLGIIVSVILGVFAYYLYKQN